MSIYSHFADLLNALDDAADAAESPAVETKLNEIYAKVETALRDFNVIEGDDDGTIRRMDAITA